MYNRYHDLGFIGGRNTKKCLIRIFIQTSVEVYLLNFHLRNYAYCEKAWGTSDKQPST